jgi:protein-L-isoaspartate(D-aspartate) O-methyltransferase
MFKSSPSPLASIIQQNAESFDQIDAADLSSLLSRIGDSKLVLLGEATHGTSEFYRMRAHISKALIIHKGFNFIAAEADWPDASLVNRYICRTEESAKVIPEPAFTRFPVWMWRNQEFLHLVEWLRIHNHSIQDSKKQVEFFGLDIYSLYRSIAAVVEHLDKIDPELGHMARRYYGCLAPWQEEPSHYGAAFKSGRYKGCEEEVLTVLHEIFKKQMTDHAFSQRSFLDTAQNARLVANAERYYRTMYSSIHSSWNLRDQHMFETLQTLLSFKGKDSKGIVWAHNSHIGNASATDMKKRGEFNIGQLCREQFGEDAYSIGFGTHEGTVAAASEWNEPMEIKQVRPSMEGSYERIFHSTRIPIFMLPLRSEHQEEVRNALSASHLERAIGVIYQPETEYWSHYFSAHLPQQFDEYIWFNQTTAITPLAQTPSTTDALPDTYPFGL